MLIGNVGQDPEVRYVDQGVAAALGCAAVCLLQPLQQTAKKLYDLFVVDTHIVFSFKMVVNSRF